MADDKNTLALLATPQGKLALVREIHKELQGHMDRLVDLRKSTAGTVPGPHVTGGEVPPTVPGKAARFDWHSMARDAQLVERFIKNPVGTLRSYVYQRAAQEEADNYKAQMNKNEVVPRSKKVPAEGSGELLLKTGMSTNKPPAIAAPRVPVAKPPSGGTTAAPPTGISPAKQTSAPKISTKGPSGLDPLKDGLGKCEGKCLKKAEWGALLKSEKCALCGKPEHPGKC